jgi:hypothetical protein
LAVVDGVDFWIPEPPLKEGEDYERKNCKLLPLTPSSLATIQWPRLWYEMATCIQKGDIVWTNGSFPAGRWSDAKIFQYKLRQMHDNEEMVEADGTYLGMPNKVRML